MELKTTFSDNILRHPPAKGVLLYPLSQSDSVAVAAQRAAAAPMKGKLGGTAARDPFNSMMEQVLVPEGVTFEADTIGGIPGWWAKPAKAPKGAAIIHLHGGWFNFGAARAFRNLVGHLALSARANAFIPDYRLAPEHPFPAAVTDVEASYRGLIEKGITSVAITGDSAGGNLALVLLSIASQRPAKGGIKPVGAVAFSPITDLTLAGESYHSRAEADPFFTKAQAAGLVVSYLGAADPKNPLASPLYGEMEGLPPVRIHVGEHEVLFDDSRRYVERAIAAGIDAELGIWLGMPHGFINGVGGLDAATRALDSVGVFLTERIERTLQDA